MQVTGNNVTVYYKVVYHTPAGLQVAELDYLEFLNYAKGVGKPGWLTLRVPKDFIAWRDFYQLDAQVEVLRRVEGFNWYTEMGTRWLMRRFDKISDHGAVSFECAGQSAYGLVGRRIVAYNAGSAQADQTDQADDMMKTIIKQNLGSSATGTGRDLSAYLAVAADTAAGPSVQKSFSRRQCDVVIDELIMGSDQAGTVVYPDVIWNGAKFEFKTYPNQRGTDRTSGTSQVVFAEQFDNLSNVRLRYDHTNEVTDVYAGGQGDGSARDVQEAQDLGRMDNSPFNRIERFVNASHCTTSAQVLDEAEAALQAGLPVISLTGIIKQTPACIYGKDWGLGDKVIARADDIDFNAWIDPVDVTVSPEGETIRADIYAVQ